jgi:hypothetical protein
MSLVCPKRCDQVQRPGLADIAPHRVSSGGWSPQVLWEPGPQVSFVRHCLCAGNSVSRRATRSAIRAVKLPTRGEFSAEHSPVLRLQNERSARMGGARKNWRELVEDLEPTVCANAPPRSRPIKRPLPPPLPASRVPGLTGPWSAKALPSRPDGDPNPSGRAEPVLPVRRAGRSRTTSSAWSSELVVTQWSPALAVQAILQTELKPRIVSTVGERPEPDDLNKELALRSILRPPTTSERQRTSGPVTTNRVLATLVGLLIVAVAAFTELRDEPQSTLIAGVPIAPAAESMTPTTERLEPSAPSPEPTKTVEGEQRTAPAQDRASHPRSTRRTAVSTSRRRNPLEARLIFGPKDI